MNRCWTALAVAGLSVVSPRAPADEGGVPVSRAVRQAERRPLIQPTCGVDSLYFILRALGREPSLTDLSESVPLTDRGASLADLRAAARSHGLSYECVRCAPEELHSLPMPAIAHIAPAAGSDLAHYVVLLAVRSNTVVVFDPNDNRFVEVPIQEFNRKATGTYLAEYRPLFPDWLIAAWAAAGVFLGASWWAANRPTGRPGLGPARAGGVPGRAGTIPEGGNP